MNENESDDLHPADPIQPIRHAVRCLPESKDGIAIAAPERPAQGLEPSEALGEWLRFAKGAGHLRVTGQRQFGSDLEKIEVMEHEARSLYCFACSIGLGIPEVVKKAIAESPPRKSGAEHKVFFNPRGKQGRVIKITFPGKYGRREYTPFQYIERWALFAEMVPAAGARFEDCLQTEDREISIVTSMQYFQGPHPSPLEVDVFVKSLGFELLKDGSITFDYIDRNRKLILRDCHAKNWVKSNGGSLVPIDIIPELAV